MALRQACRTVASPSRLARTAPPLRGFGLDGLPTARPLSHQSIMFENEREPLIF
jgi:hypothetical protein